jgi:hypothetical protein
VTGQHFDRLSDRAEGERLTAQGFSNSLCPNHLGDCYIKPNGMDIAQQTLEQLTTMLSTFIGNW